MGIKDRLSRSTPAVRVQIERGKSLKKDYSFNKAFCIGRDESCDICIDDQIISRKHIKICCENGEWWVHDLQSANGTFFDGNRIERIPLTGHKTIELGIDGPIVSLSAEGTRENVFPTGKNLSETQYIRKYFSASPQPDAGEQTMYIRRAFKQVQNKQKRKYQMIIAAAAALLVLTGAYAVIQHIRIQRHKEFAVDFFYHMKRSELEIAQLSNNIDAGKSKNDLAERNKDYNQYLRTQKLGEYHRNMSDEERLILKVAVIFGECNVNLPKNFVREVKKYIKKWQSNASLKNAIQRAKSNKYIIEITREMQKQGLAPHFFYIALQESKFDVNACGPKTNFGYAKGMWQFIPGTAEQYGLKLGPDYKLRKPDPLDERHNFSKATKAAAKYIKYIYDTDAQASGLLVMASYNWGERRVIKLINKMPMNPQERNFWCLMEDYIDNIPEETYDYVFRIFSAAVIGENPRLFGFDFDNPLSYAEIPSQ